MKALVTGFGGLIGSECVRLLAHKGWNVIGVDNDMRRLFFGDAGTPGVDQPSLNAPVRWLIYFSLMTSSFVLADFQWPGYSDSLSFILILLLA